MAKKKAEPASTEVDAYNFIEQNLKALGWDTRNPEKVATGQVWTQNECNSNTEIKRLLGAQHPEDTIKVTEKNLWVIEAKRTHKELEKAISEAEDYAKLLNASSMFKVTFISGVAGNDDDSFLIRTRFLKNGKYVPVCMNGIEVTGLLTPDNCAHILHTGEPNIENPPPR